ncbi:peroxiredoxin [Texcoconibacillus texcoconensis]|uniref:Peroxiredoxin n=1 Tax=Texcoconibacillus texcoconensis TaxID=1095777 RepID=A0A840QIF1_9BACI|nr:peroxiredoxin [Texcoconibacillus texcoconensis]
MSEDLDTFEEENYNIYAISPSRPDQHRELAEELETDIEFLTDIHYEFGVTHGFIDPEEQFIDRGYLAVNPDTEQMAKEVDYLVADHFEEVLNVLEDL